MRDRILPELLEYEDEMIALRHHLHTNPEMGFEEDATSALVASKLAEWGYTLDRGMGGTGIVATLSKGNSKKSIGIRADMDALPIEETSNLPWSSKVPGKMHACGHDGHTVTLLAAARWLAEHGKFNGSVHLIFQPAEETLGGARKMIEDGLFEKFPCDSVFALHNMPGLELGKIGYKVGPLMASADKVSIRVEGRGGHGAMPHQTIDPIVVASSIVMALQTVVSRNISPTDSAIITVGAFHAGSAGNVISDNADLELTVRALSKETRETLIDRIRIVAEQQAQSFGAKAIVEFSDKITAPVLVNSEKETELVRELASAWLGAENVVEFPTIMGSEDFSYMLDEKSGSYFVIGNGLESCNLHNPGFDFNDTNIIFGATFWAKLVEKTLS